MLNIQTPLFESQDIRLGPINYENDPEIESGWTHDSEFMRLMELKDSGWLPSSISTSYCSI